MISLHFLQCIFCFVSAHKLILNFNVIKMRKMMCTKYVCEYSCYCELCEIGNDNAMGCERQNHHWHVIRAYRTIKRPAQITNTDKITIPNK